MLKLISQYFNEEDQAHSRKPDKIFAPMVKIMYLHFSLLTGRNKLKMDVYFYFIMQGTNGETGPPGTKGTQGLKVNVH